MIIGESVVICSRSKGFGEANIGGPKFEALIRYSNLIKRRETAVRVHFDQY